MPYTYEAKLPPTAVTVAKTLLQIKAGNAPLEILEVKVHQVTKTTSEMLDLQLLRKTAAATVTSMTPLKLETTAPAALAIGGTAATGYNASAEGTDGDILHEDVWNVLDASWHYLPVGEARIWVPVAGIWAVKLVTAPAASMTIGCVVTFREYQG